VLVAVAVLVAAPERPLLGPHIAVAVVAVAVVAAALPIAVPVRAPAVAEEGLSHVGSPLPGPSVGRGCVRSLDRKPPQHRGAGRVPGFREASRCERRRG